MDRKEFFKRVAVGAATMAGGSALSSHQRASASIDKSAQLAPHQSIVAVAAAELYARMTVRPTRARRSAIESLISSLITTDVWPKLDGLYIFAAHDVQAARLNWVGCMQDIVSVNAPVFQVDRGFIGDGQTSYLDTNTQASALENFQPDDATMAVYAVGAYGTPVDVPAIGVSGSYMCTSKDAQSIALRANFITGEPISIDVTDDRLGAFAWSRCAKTVTIYRAGAKVSETEIPAGSVSSGHITILKIGSEYSNRAIAAAAIGAGLSSANHEALNLALATYMATMED